MPSRKSPKTETETAASPAPATQEPDAPQGAVVGIDMGDPAGDKTAEKLVVQMGDLGHARALPEAPAGEVLRLDEVVYAPGSIEQFADEDGRTMRIVSIGGVLHKYPAEAAAEA